MWYYDVNTAYKPDEKLRLSCTIIYNILCDIMMLTLLTSESGSTSIYLPSEQLLPWLSHGKVLGTVPQRPVNGSQCLWVMMMTIGTAVSLMFVEFLYDLSICLFRMLGVLK